VKTVLLSTLLIFPTPPTFILFVFFTTFFTLHALLTNLADQLHRPTRLTNSSDQLV
jgi:hypothetical protein